MNAVILDGSLPGETRLEPYREILENVLKNNVYQLKSILLHDKKIGTCIGCFKCWDHTPGECFQKDDAPEIMRQMAQADLLVFLTPLLFGGYSSELKKMIERTLGLLHPGQTRINGESHHLKRYDKYPSILGLAVTDSLDEEEILIFKKLGDRHSLNFYPPRHLYEVLSSSQPAEERGKSITALLSELGVLQ
jgi:multimeric flavodoxin WrbA